MPRDGSNVYSLPPSVTAAPGETIQSAKWNSALGDLAADQNTPRPVSAGGTGAATGTAALANLGGAPLASPAFTGAPTVNGNGVWHAGNFDPALKSDVGHLHTIPNVTGLQTALDAKLNLAGGTLTGDISINKVTPTFALNTSAAAQSNQISGLVGGVQRWLVRPGNVELETGAGAGSNFDILRYNDAGVYSGQPLVISRSTGQLILETRPSWGGMTPWDSGNFNPASYALLSGANFASLSVAGSAVWHAGNLNPSAYAQLTGAAFTGNISISNPGPSITLTDTAGAGAAARYIYHDGGEIGFLGSAVSWVLRVNDAGAVWTAQFGDLNTRIESRADAYAASYANSRFSAARYVFVGDLDNSWNAGGGFGDPYGGSASVVDRATFGHFSQPSGNHWLISALRFRQLQMFSSSGGWVNIGVV